MNIAIRLFLGYFLIVGVAAWFVVNIFAREVEPGVRQATEDTLVDSANLLAELAADDLVAGRIAHGRFAAALADAQRRAPGALIWGVSKNTVDTRVYVTDRQGIVRFDSAGATLGADFSQWRDVALALRGEYGARSTRIDPADPRSSMMYVAAPIVRRSEIVGVLTVAKPLDSLLPYAERAQERVWRSGAALLAVSAAIGLVFTLWLTWSLNRLRDYARAVADGRKAVAPAVGGRQLSELARALAQMREKLDGKQYVEHYVQTLTHEMKSPLAAIAGAAEVLQEEPGADERRLFVRHIAEQADRMERVIQRLLVLTRVEQMQVPEAVQDVALAELARAAVASRTGQLRTRGIVATVTADDGARLRGDPFLLQQAVDNLIDNAIDFSPEGGTIHISVTPTSAGWELAVHDQGVGAPDYAMPRLFERFYSLPRPTTGRKSTGLGLAFVREVAKLHGGTADFANRPGGGAVARILLPR